jgi:Fe-S-cluster containining protein
MVLPVVKPLQKSIMVDWLGARGCRVVKETNDAMFVEIESPCPHLIKSAGKFSCEIYNERPEGCRIFDGRKFDFLECAWKENYVVLEKSKRR